MSDMYTEIVKLCESRKISGYRLCKDIGMQPSQLTDLKMGRQKTLSMANAQKVADYFGVSVSDLLGKDQQKTPAPVKGEREYSDQALLDAFNRADEATKAAIRLLLKVE